jgi:hypothetical protein
LDQRRELQRLREQYRIGFGLVARQPALGGGEQSRLCLLAEAADAFHASSGTCVPQGFHGSDAERVVQGADTPRR